MSKTMAIINASTQDVELITNMLINEYTELNKKIGSDFYRTDKEFLSNHVKSNIDNPESGFKYFLLQDEANEIVGMINTLIHGDKGEILMIAFKDGFKNQENYSELLNYGIDYLKGKQVKHIYFETHPTEEIYINALNNLNAQIISNKRILTNNA